MPRPQQPSNAAAGRRCGTPGCDLRDFHDGPCTVDQPSSKRPRYVPPPPKPRVQRSTSGGSGMDGGAKKRRRRKRPLVVGGGGDPPDGADGEDAESDGSSAANVDKEPPKPAIQFELPSGLHRFYHVHRWGVPLAEGPVEALTGNGSDGEGDEDWRHDERLRRMRTRPELEGDERELMARWNAHVQALETPLVSDRSLTDACRRFAVAHAGDLSGSLRAAFRAHLEVLWEHNLLHRDDILDCLVLAESSAGAGAGAGAGDATCFASAAACQKCLRPVHESHCALARRVRGAAAWPSSRPDLVGLDASELASALLPGGPKRASC